MEPSTLGVSGALFILGLFLSLFDGAFYLVFFLQKKKKD